MWLVCTILNYVTAVLLIICSIIRFVYIMEIETFSGIALTIYLIIFAVILICVEASAAQFRTWFYFMNFGWGKGLAHIFICSIVLGSGAAVLWLDILLAIYLCVVAIWMPIISLCYRSEEEKHVERKLQEIEDKKNESSDDEDDNEAEGQENEAGPGMAEAPSN
jgi:hypothetical protein